MEVEELLARAWSAVEKAGIPEPLQEFAFREALARLSGRTAPPPTKQTPGDSTTSDQNGVETQTNGAAGSTLSADELFAKFSNESGIAVEDLERAFYFGPNGEPHLNGPRSKLGRSTADQAKTVAVALTAAYDFALDKPAADDVVRAEVVRLKCDIGGNWSRTMNGLTTVSWIGANRQKQFKVKSDTAEALKRIVASILGTPAE